MRRREALPAAHEAAMQGNGNVSATDGLMETHEAAMPDCKRMTGGSAGKRGAGQEAAVYMAPRELAARWRCARSSVDRIARRAGLTRVCLGDGANGMIRYIREEIEAFERRCRIGMAPERG